MSATTGLLVMNLACSRSIRVR